MAGFFRGCNDGLRVETRHLPAHKRAEILAGWVELITRYSWDVFATLTWRKESSGEVMLRNFGWRAPKSPRQ